MTAVSASPSLVSELSDTLSSGAETLALRSNGLRGALDDFYASRSEFGPTSSPVPDVLDSQGQLAQGLSNELDRFVSALSAADRDGATIAIGRFLLGSNRDLVLIDQAVLGGYVPIEPGTTVAGLIARARARHAAHLAREPSPAAYDRSIHNQWFQELSALENQLRQLETLADPPHDRWAGAGVDQYTSAQALSGALALGQAQARSREAAGLDGPFLAAALEHDALLTPGRVAILTDLDALAAMPLEDFLRARAAAEDDRPAYDWTADGCSGPIPGRAEDTCLRHDFLYRNSRMIRDQWGVRPELAGDVKDYADNRFGDELEATYAWWERALNNPLSVWLDGAEAAVTLFGDVGATWNPPPPGEFYGGVEPDRPASD